MKVFLKARGWEKIKTYMSVPLYQSSIILPSVYKVLSLMCMCTYLCSYTSLCMHSCGCKHVNGSAFEGQSQRLVSFHRNYVPCFKTGALNSIEFAKMLRVAGKGTPGIFLISASPDLKLQGNGHHTQLFTCSGGQTQVFMVVWEVLYQL